MPMRASRDVARTAIEAVRALGLRAVVSQGADQPCWATRVRELGIGAAHDGPAPTTESLSTALKAASTDQIRARATSMAATIRTDGASVAATLLMTALTR